MYNILYIMFLYICNQGSQQIWKEKNIWENKGRLIKNLKKLEAKGRLLNKGNERQRWLNRKIVSEWNIILYYT